MDVLPWDPLWRPIALSFYVFHMVSYAIDIRSDKYKPARPLDYALYLSFFPHLIAGPIVRGNQLIPQLETPRKPANYDIRGGLYDYCTGFLLKVCADRTAAVIDPYWVTGGHESLGAAGHWLVAMLYSSQIFSDFAGYTFMAIGISKLLGYVLPQNFNAPYIATTFQSFWRRWHITLSLFLRDYLYIYSLGGNRVGKLRSYLNVMITMLLGGLWHGASWNFVIWGGIHGSALTVEKVAGMEEPRPLPVRALWWLIVQVTVVIAWVFFRSPTLYGAVSFVRSMFLPAQGGTRSAASLRGCLYDPDDRPPCCENSGCQYRVDGPLGAAGYHNRRYRDFGDPFLWLSRGVHLFQFLTPSDACFRKNAWLSFVRRDVLGDYLVCLRLSHWSITRSRRPGANLYERGRLRGGQCRPFFVPKSRAH